MSERAATASLSDTGMQRSVNQDSCSEFADERGRQLLVVADGMGGHAGGETASRIAVETMGRVFTESDSAPREMLGSAVAEANAAIRKQAAETLELRGMGTTVVALLLDGNDTGWVVHVGDSRAYRLRHGRLERITRDHSMVTQLMELEGLTQEEAEASEHSHVLLRAVGPDPSVESELKAVSIEAGDRFLLCSDGLWGQVDERQIEAVLAGYEPARAAEILIDQANKNGGPDNITVQIAAIPGGPTAHVESEITLTDLPEPRAEEAPAPRGPGLLGLVAIILGLALLGAGAWLVASIAAG